MLTTLVTSVANCRQPHQLLGPVAHACSHTAAYTQPQGQPRIKPVAVVQFPAKREFVLKVNAMDVANECRVA